MKALILVAHADDESLGAGGTIQKLAKADWDVQVVIMADGIVRTRGDTTQDNRGHAQEACAELGIGEPVFVGFPDQKFDSFPMSELAGKVGALGYEPDLIITHAHTDLNRDHRLTLEVARIIGRPRHKPVSILGCEVPNTSIWNNQVFPANYYVDITHVLKTKISAFSKYKYELQAFPHPWSVEGLNVLAKYRGMQAGLPLAEAFHLYRGYEGRLPT